MTPPPPAPLAWLVIDYRGLLRRAPVSDHSTPGRVPVRVLPAPHRKATNVWLVGAWFFVGVACAAKTHAVGVLAPAGRPVAASPAAHTVPGFTGLTPRRA